MTAGLTPSRLVEEWNGLSVHESTEALLTKPNASVPVSQPAGARQLVRG